MLECADSARRDDRHAHRIGNGAGQCDVEAGFGAVSVHRGQQDLAGPVTSEAACPFDSVDTGRPATTMGENFPFTGRNRLCVDRRDDALAAEFLGRLAHEFGVRDRGGVDRYLVAASEQQFADVLDRAHAAADGQRHKALLGGAAHDVVERVATFVARSDVEKTEFVCAFAIVDARLLDGIAGIGQIDKVDALDDASVLDVEARDDAHLQHADAPWAPSSTRRNAARASRRPS